MISGNKKYFREMNDNVCRGMDNQSFVPDNIPADLDKSWHIPRPTLARSSNGSQGSTSSNNSSQSARSGSLLLTTANLAQIHQDTRDAETRSSAGGMSTRDRNIQYYLERSDKDNEFLAALPKTYKGPEPDTASIASSMHFTVVNMNSRPPRAPKRSFCRKHQLTILVLSMSALFTMGIIVAIYLLEMRARDQRRH